jgi:hypothetical protein
MTMKDLSVEESAHIETVLDKMKQYAESQDKPDHCPLNKEDQEVFLNQYKVCIVLL